MATDNWIDGGANWNTAADWSSGVPTNTANVVVAQGEPQVTAGIAIASLVNSSDLSFDDAGASSISGTVSNSGFVFIDTNSGEGGSNLTIGGVLTNKGFLYVGSEDDSLSKSDTIQAAGLDNSGAVFLYGGGSSSTEALLKVSGKAGFGTAGALTGQVALFGHSTIEFSSGQITTIQKGGSLLLSGPNAFVADSGTPTSNSALTGLTSNSGTLELEDGAAIAIASLANSSEVIFAEAGASSISGTMSNSYSLLIDYPSSYASNVQGGSTLTVGGALTNSGTIWLGNSSLSKSDMVEVGGLVNSTGSGATFRAGSIFLAGGGSSSAEALLKVSGKAGFGTAGVLIGRVGLSGYSAIEFDSNQITTIQKGASLSLSGPNAFVADSGSPTSNSALTGLTSVAGLLQLSDGANVTTSAALDNTGGIALDVSGNGNTLGSSLKVEGDFANAGVTMSGYADMLTVDGVVTDTGNGGFAISGSADVVTAKALVNTSGTIGIKGLGSATTQDVLDIAGPAGFGTAGVLSGQVQLSGYALIEFGSDQIKTIQKNAALTLGGPHAFVADAGALNSDSALKGLSSVQGALDLTGGATFATSGALDVSGSIGLYSNAFYPNGTPDGSNLYVGGALTNEGLIAVGAGISGIGCILTVKGVLTNSFDIDMYSGDESLKQSNTLTTGGLVNHGSFFVTGTETNPAGLAAKINGAFINDGSVFDDGSADFLGAVSGSGGTFTMKGVSPARKSTLEFDFGVSTGQTVDMTNGAGGADELILGTNAAKTFAGLISDFGKGDELDVKGFGTGTKFNFAENGSNTGGVLTLTNGGNVAHIGFNGQYGNSDFSITSTASESLIKFV